MKYAIALILALASPLAFAVTGVSGALNLLVYLVIVALIFWCIWWFVGYVGIPEPFNKVIRVVLGLVALIIVVNILLGMIGQPIFRF